jgi:ABC-2 type transport system permease protein
VSSTDSTSGSPAEERRPLGLWTAVRLVAGRELSTRLRSKAFRVMTVVMVVVAVALPLVLKAASGSDEAAKVGFLGSAAALQQPFKATAKATGEDVDPIEVGRVRDGLEQVSDGELDALVTGSATKFKVIVKEELDDKLKTPFDLLARQLAQDTAISAQGGDPAKVNQAVAAAKVDVAPLQKATEYNTSRVVLGLLVGILIYISLFSFGQMVAQGVVEEKTSRVVELLLASISPTQLMAGKVLGIGAVGLINLALTGAAGFATAVGTGVLDLSVGSAIGILAWLVVWYLVGFFMYALLLAGAAAMVSRQEEVGGVIAPVLMLLMIPYVVGVTVLPSDPGNTLAEVLSIVPLFAPMLMPARLALGNVPVWEAALSLGLAVALIPALVWLSARIYRNSVLRTGAKVTYRESMRSL